MTHLCIRFNSVKKKEMAQIIQEQLHCLWQNSCLHLIICLSFCFFSFPFSDLLSIQGRYWSPHVYCPQERPQNGRITSWFPVRLRGLQHLHHAELQRLPPHLCQASGRCSCCRQHQRRRGVRGDLAQRWAQSFSTAERSVFRMWECRLSSIRAADSLSEPGLKSGQCSIFTENA